MLACAALARGIGPAGVQAGYRVVSEWHAAGAITALKPATSAEPLLVMLLHIAGTKHQAQLVKGESTRPVMAALREVIETQGLFC